MGEPREIPQHVAIIMDGNGRWAKARNQPRAFGHRAGVEAVRRSVTAAGNLGIKHLTLFGFSTENWTRPQSEVDALFDLMRRFVDADLKKLDAENVRIRIIGRRDNLSEDLLKIIEKAEFRTKNNDRFHLTIAFNYGGRDEILRAAKKLANDLRNDSSISLDNIDITSFTEYLDTADMPDPELVIRTSGEQRVSNFLLWQGAYSEYIFLDALWPDFDEQALRGAVDAYSHRDRRYGGIKND